jgi:hypothetical protein
MEIKNMKLKEEKYFIEKKMILKFSIEIPLNLYV